MISLIEALNFRSLRFVSQPLGRFHVLVGPNASGKTTFLDVVDFLGVLLADGLQAAIRKITPDPRDLLFNRTGDRFELAIEAQLPDHVKPADKPEFQFIRYEISIGINTDTGVPSIQAERVLFIAKCKIMPPKRSLFPDIGLVPESFIGKDRYKRKAKQIASKNKRSGKDNYYPEIKRGSGSGWVPSFQLGNQKSVFANLPEDEERFPAATWFKNFLIEGTQKLVLDSLEMRKASPPGQPNKFATDGVNLPWVIQEFKEGHPCLFEDWVGHLRTALPDLNGIDTILRDDTRHRYLVIHYDSGITVPSWMVSDGTLRLLALTLPAYLPDFEGVLLIEEPENGIHPRAVETVFQSLSSVYGAQILLATHSPVVLNSVDPKDVLCFAKDSDGSTDIVRGDLHPQLVDWQQETSMGTLLAAGVLG